MNDAILDIIERSMRLVRQATEFDFADRAILNFVLHDAIDQVESMHARSTRGDCEDVDELTARLTAANTNIAALQAELADTPRDVTNPPLDTIAWSEQDWNEGYAAAANSPARSDWYNRGAVLAMKSAALTACSQARREEQDAANVQLGTLRSTLAELHEAIGHRYDIGYHAGVNDDPAPVANTSDEWFSRGFKAGQAQCDIVGLRLDCDQLRKRLADAEAAMDGVVANDAEINRMDRRIAELESELAATRERLLTTETSTQNQTTPTAILDASPAELAAVATHTNGAEPAATEPATTGKSKGFRFAGTDQELHKRTIDAIKAMAKRIGRTPTIIDWDVDCRTYGLPTFQAIQGRLNCSWATLVTAAGMTPSRKGSRHEGI